VTPDPDSIAFADPRGLGDLVPEPRWIADGFSALAAPVGIPINELSPRLLFAGPIPGTPGWDTVGIVVAITLPSDATAVSAAVIASRVNEDGIALSVDSRIYVLPPGLLELSGLALRLEAPTGRIPTPNGRGAATTVSLLVLAPPGYATARPLGPGDVLVSTDIPLEEGLAIVTYPEPTVRWCSKDRMPTEPR